MNNDLAKETYIFGKITAVETVESGPLEGKLLYAWKQLNINQFTLALQTGDPYKSSPGATSKQRYPTIELNNQSIPVNTIVRLWPTLILGVDGYIFDAGGGGGVEWYKITAIPSEDPGPYSGVRGHLDELGDWVNESPTFTVETLYRAPSNDTPPRIPVDQVVLAIPDPESPGKYRMTPWGGYFRYKLKIFIGAHCNGGNIVNVYKWEYHGSREKCISPAPPD